MEHSLEYKAYQFAEEKHKGQVRKYTGEPYINHPVAVALRAQEYVPFLGREIVSAAFLHDTIEDCHVSHGELAALFGNKVADIVLGLTQPDKLAELAGQPKLPRQVRHEKNMEHLAMQSQEVLVLKGIDRWCNLLDCPLHNQECVHFLRKRYIGESADILNVLKAHLSKEYEDLIWHLRDVIDYLKERVA
jgi:(p)ppGpp synthase/HD superfamily hydrolase